MQGNPVDSPISSQASSLESGLYVDVENLGDAAQSVVKAVVESWPSSVPKPTRLNLYVRADYAQLWEMWATSQFPEMTIFVKGIQHFSTHQAKNSADIAMAVDAIADLLRGRIGFLAVLSDDSDFIALYAKAREETSVVGGEPERTPFIWIMTDREGTRSSTISDYFPNDYIHVVHFPANEVKKTPAGPDGVSPKRDNKEPWTEMAIEIIRDLPAGQFKSIDTQAIIRRHWPKHSLANADRPGFGSQFAKSIWPVLEARGVVLQNPGKNPRRYDMTEAAKRTLS